MDPLGLRLHSHFQSFVGMRRVDMVTCCITCRGANFDFSRPHILRRDGFVVSVYTSCGP